MATGHASDLDALLQITAILLMPAVLGHSMGRALRVAPSLFSHFALSAYFRRQRLIDGLWLAFAAVWFAYTIMLPGGVASVQLAVGGLLVGSTGSFLWTHRVMLMELARAAPSAAGAATDVAPVDSSGYFERRHNAVDAAMAIRASRRMVMINGSLGTFAVLILVTLALQADAFADLRGLVGVIVLVGLWLSLRVLVMDLAMDTWPGVGIESHLRRTFTYYVQMFEQWVVRGVLVSIMIMMVVAPVASLMGYVPAVTASFALWAILCMVVAIVWNKLHGAGRVPTALALPMQVNRYSARNPTWAYAVTIMHLGMACCLAAGIAAMNGLLS